MSKLEITDQQTPLQLSKAGHSGGESPAQRVPATSSPKRGRPPKPVDKYADLRKKREAYAKSRSNKPFEYLRKEVVIDKNGVPRQAGADSQEGEFILKLRSAAEKSLYFFAKGVLNLGFLTPHFHQDVCNFQQLVPPFRKLTLMPREHAKTAIVAGGLPPHILIQPADTNIYFPGLDGSECRILMAGETQPMAEKNLRVIESVHSDNQLFRALWPSKCWDEPKRQAKQWSQKALIFPRATEYPDPTIWAKGVGGAVTGSRPNVIIKDDLISYDASKSAIIMDDAIDWHIVSRALLDSYEKESGLQSLEFIIGTRWAVYDLYSYIQDNDPSVEVISDKYHSIIKNNKILWPEKHTKTSIDTLRQEYKDMFYLLFLNNAADSALTDFSLDDVRDFKLINDAVIFEKTEIDELLQNMGSGDNMKLTHDDTPGQPNRLLTPDKLDALVNRHEYLRLRAT